MKQKIILQFNEANFDLIKLYIEKYNLPALKKILSFPIRSETISESENKYLEPWIQWYSFYTELSYRDHKVFHLGDCLKHNHKTIFDKKFKNKEIGIFGSMNLSPNNRFKIYIPDPWTEVKSDSSFASRMVSDAIRKVVNSNVKLRISLYQIIGILYLVGVPKSLTDIRNLILGTSAFFRKYRDKIASYFDLYFVNYCLRSIKKNKLDISFIFLNGFAHVQHHYLLDSEFHDGENPDWYSNKNIDSIHRSLIIYDKLFDKVLKNCGKDYEIWIVTALTQTPVKEPIFYWRFKNHKDFINNFINYDCNINPRMTRDFEIVCRNNQDKKKIVTFLKDSYVLENKKKVKAFRHIDTKYDKRIFTSFTYSGDIKKAKFVYKNKSILLKNQLDFVAIKNGKHLSKGWVFSNSKTKIPKKIKLWNIPKYLN